MIRSMQLAIIKKDMLGIVTNKRVLLTMLIVPLTIMIVLPSIFILLLHFAPEEITEFEVLLEMMPNKDEMGDVRQAVMGLLLNYIMPMFFLLIPIMASSVMAASSFVGEKEKRTLETLLYSPLSIKQIFYAKILASFFISMIVSLISFFTMIIVMEVEMLLTADIMILPDINWLIILFLFLPSVSLIAITLIVRGSAKAQTMEEAQQAAVFLVLPIMLLIVGQFTGILLIGRWILLGLGVLLTLIAGIFIKGAIGKWSYETLLR